MSLETGYETWEKAAGLEGRASGGKDRKFVSALGRGLEVLRAFTPAEGLLGNRDIAQRTGLPKPTVSRLTYTLTKLGYLVHVERIGKYQLAPGALAIGYATLANMRIRQIARPYMQELANFGRASVALGTRDRLNVLCGALPQSGERAAAARSGIAYSAGDHGGRAGPDRRPPRARARLACSIWRAASAPPGRKSAPGSSRRSKTSRRAASPSRSANGIRTSARSACRSCRRIARACSRSIAGRPAFQISREQLETDLGPRLVNLARNVEAALNGA